MENFRDAELKKWLAEEYEKETEEMEKMMPIRVRSLLFPALSPPFKTPS